MTGLNRRQWSLAAGAGIAALGAGAWLNSRVGPGTAQAATAAAAAPLPAPIKTLDGRTLGNADLHGRAVILNFWAPWCPPCVREMPELDRFARSAAAHDAVVIGLAIDELPAVQKFLAAHPVSFPIAVLGYAGLSWVRALSGDGNNALPFSAVYDRSGKLVQRKFGATDLAELQAWSKHF